MYPDIELHVNKYRGTISTSWQKFVRVSCEVEAEEPQLLWKMTKLSSLGIDKDAVRLRFQQSLIREEDDEGLWCP